MTWSVLAYARPYLAADEVRDDEGVIVLASGGEEYEIVVDDGEGGDLLAALDDLRDPASTRWADAELADLFAELDRLGLVRDAAAAAEAASAVAAAEADLADAVAAAAAWLRDLRSAVAPTAFARAVAVLAGSAAPEGNFYLALLESQLRLWRRTAPLSIRAVAELADRLGADVALPRTPAGGAYGVHEVRVHLDCLTALVALSCRPDAARVCVPPEVPPVATTGTQFVLNAERAAHAALRALGTTRYHALLTADPPERLAEGTFVEQYHATRRYVEVITPLLAKRFSDDLRAALFRYYAEEIGHEVYELRTCEGLGLDPDAVAGAMPVPLWTSFIDVLSDLAETEPVSLFACLIATEGMPSSRAPVNELFEEHGLLDGVDAGEHEELNEELDHVTMARRLFRLLPAVTPDEQARALDALLVVVEAGVRGWNLLHDYYTDPSTPRYRSFLALPPAWYLGAGR